jgi:hypothetical protein
MTGRDPIASATLAQLYISQGHLRKAKTVIAEVLERAPMDGAALQLRSRLSAVSEAQLSAAADDAEIALRWQQTPAGTHAIVVCFVGGVVRVDSVACASASGRWSLRRPSAAGSAVACIGHVVPGRGFVAVCTARPLSWEVC